MKNIDLEFPLIKFHPTEKSDWWTVKDAFEGVQIFGGIGSGKTSGSGREIAHAFLSNGFGGVVLCAKPEEAKDWKKLALKCGRNDDLLIFREGTSFEFNPLEYEINREGKGAGDIFNLTNLFMEIYKMGNRFSGGSSGGENERFWDSALKRCIRRLIQLLKLAKEPISIDNMRRLLSNAFNEKEAGSFRNLSDRELEDFTESNYCMYCLRKAEDLIEDDEANYAYDLVSAYFCREFASLQEKTRGIIVESFMGMVEPFTGGILKKHFAGQTTIWPEATFEGKIIILDFSVKEYLQAGIYAQGIFKFLWQQAIERRDIDKHPNPAFLWVDESHYFINDYDMIFQTTARSKRACSVFITQNISNYYAQMGGASVKAKVDSLLGNLSTKIFHCNNDAVTNNWASEVIGKDFLPLESGSTNASIISPYSSTTGFSTSLTPQVLPVEFTTLWGGGKYYNLKVQAVIQIRGRTWSNEKNYKKVQFTQKEL